MTDTAKSDAPADVTEPISNVRHADRVRMILLVGIALLTWLPRLRGPIDFRWDGCVYYVLGTSLATGHGYRLLSEPGNIAAIQYPPLLPAIIALHQRVMGTTDFIAVGHALRISFMFLFMGYVGAVYRLTRHFLSPNFAFAATAFCLFNVQICFMSDACYPEILYGFATVLFVLCSRSTVRWKRSVGAAGFVIAAYALRTVGIVALAAWVLESLIAKRWRCSAMRIVIALLPVLLWQRYIHRVETSAAYMQPAYTYQRADYMFYNISYARSVRLKDQFMPEMGYLNARDVAQRLLGNAMGMPESLGQAVSADNNRWTALWKGIRERLRIRSTVTWPVHVIPILFGIVVFAGIKILVTKREWLIATYVVLSLLALCATPWLQQFGRYLTPLCAFLDLALFLALQAILKPPGYVASGRLQRVRRALAVGTLTTLALVHAFLFGYTYWKQHPQVQYRNLGGRQIAYPLFYYTDAHRAFDQGLDRLMLRAKPGEVAACSMPSWAYLRTGLKSVMPPLEVDPAKATALLDSVPVHYLFIDDGLAVDTRRYMIPVVTHSPERWRLIYSASIVQDGKRLKDRFQIYERIPPISASVSPSGTNSR
ncbi:MAG: hypothetical protein JWL77_373 [Chthonomonadaceae bacterium]|nr:hypothetical protein [Chthonomonadaceae bacterium]